MSMKIFRSIFLLILFVNGGILFANPSDSVFAVPDSAGAKYVAERIFEQLRKQIYINAKNDSVGQSELNNYMVFGDDDYFKHQRVNQAADKPIWDENHEGLLQVKQSLRLFNASQQTKYYVIVASIYNFYNFNDNTTEIRDWKSMPSYQKIKENKPTPYAYTSKNREAFLNFFNSLIAAKLTSLPGKNIVHVTATFFIPQEQKEGPKKYSLFHHQALRSDSLESFKYDALVTALRSAEAKLNETKVKEQWLSAAVDHAMHAFKEASAPEKKSSYPIVPVVCTKDSIDKRILSFAEALNKRKNPDQIDLGKKEEDYFIIQPAELNDYKNSEAYALLDDKVAYLYQTLKNHNKATNIYVLIQNTGCEVRDQGLLTDISKKVYERSSLNGKPTILITVPLWITRSDYRNDLQYDLAKADIFDNSGLLENKDLIFTDSKDIPYIIQSTYKQIKKPYTRYEAYLGVSGSIDYKVWESKGFVSGYNSVNDLFLWIKPEFYEFAELRYPSRNSPECSDLHPTREIFVPNETKYAIAVFRYMSQRNDILSRAEQTPNQWYLEEPETPLKEWCISANYKSFAKYTFEQSSFLQWLESAGILIGSHTLPEECLREFDAMEIIDPVVYGVIDVASIVPVLDTFAEGVGLLYSSARGDGENAAMYLVGLSAPLVGTGVVKAVTYTIQGAARSGKILIRGTLYLVENGVLYTDKVIKRVDDLKGVAKDILRFKNPNAVIPDDQLLQLSKVFENCSMFQMDDIAKIAAENIDDTEKITKVIKLLDNLNLNLSQIRNSVQKILGSRGSVRQIDGSTVEILMKENNEKLLIVCSPKNEGLEYAIKGSGEFVDASTQSGWRKLGDDVVADASIRMPDGTLKKDALAVVERTDGQGKKIIRIGNCFPAGHLVFLDHHRTKPIEQIQAGDSVLSMNTATGRIERNLVTRTYNRSAEQLTTIFNNGKAIVQSTPEHAFWVEAEKRYVEAKDLSVGDQLTVVASQILACARTSLARSQIAVDDLIITDTTLTVYNFEVEGLHNYFVGEQGILVHNANYADDAGLINTGDFAKLQQASSIARSKGSRVINNVKNLVNDGEALVISPAKNSPLAKKVDDYVAAFKKGDTKQQGEIGEAIAELLAKEIDNAEVLNLKINNSGHGFDVLQFENGLGSPKAIRMIESKPLNGSTVKLPMTNEGVQMGQQWIRAKIDQMLRSQDPELVRVGQLLDDNPQLLERYVLTVDKKLSQVILIKLDNF
jgi:hypothetical protein